MKDLTPALKAFLQGIVVRIRIGVPGLASAAAAARRPLAWPRLRAARVVAQLQVQYAGKPASLSPITDGKQALLAAAGGRASFSITLATAARLSASFANRVPSVASEPPATHWLRTVKEHSSSCMQHVAMLAGCCSSCGAGAWMVGHSPGWQLMIMQDCLAARASCGQALPSRQV